jgi:TRAP-type C4-dicarboxylate transport system substrate-binding protein
MTRIAIVLALLLVLPPAPAAQSKLTLKLATMAPASSVWDRQLKQMASRWQKTGRADVRIISGGALGPEEEIAVSIRARRPDPQVAAFTAVGLSKIDDAFAVFGLPFVFESYDELYDVLDRMRPTLSQRLDQKGLVLLAWGHVGWAHVFSTRPVKTLADLKQMRIWTSEGDPKMLQWYHSNGFRNATAKPSTDILLGLSSGTIEALPISPTIASAFQWNKQAKYMLDDQKVFLDAAGEMERQLKAAIPGQDKAAVAELVSRKLITVTTAEGPEWKTEARALVASMQSGMVPKEIFDEAIRARDAFRQKK